MSNAVEINRKISSIVLFEGSRSAAQDHRMAVGWQGVTEIIWRDAYRGDHSVGWYDVYAGDEVICSVNERHVALINYAIGV